MPAHRGLVSVLLDFRGCAGLSDVAHCLLRFLNVLRSALASRLPEETADTALRVRFANPRWVPVMSETRLPQRKLAGQTPDECESEPQSGKILQSLRSWRCEIDGTENKKYARTGILVTGTRAPAPTLLTGR